MKKVVVVVTVILENIPTSNNMELDINIQEIVNIKRNEFVKLVGPTKMPY